MGHAPDRQLSASQGLHSFPLSLRRCAGAPRIAVSSSSTRTTSSPRQCLPTSIARHSRVHSSSTTSIRSGRPSAVWSLTKSMPHTSSFRVARRRTMPFSPVPIRLRLRRFCGTSRPS